jgi:nephrocystin-3
MGAGNSVVQLSQEEKQTLGNIWQDIDTSPSQKISPSSFRWNQPGSRSGARASGGWKVVRVFVSSTFTDFFAEREVLVKYIFPKLREWCEQRRILLVEVDLRWGVPAESTTETILRACLGEIERCVEENSIPFFINLLGQRYGWVPTREQIPTDVFEEFQWRIGASVTHMEILRGALRAYNPRALFLLRHPSYLTALPEEFSSQYLDVSWKSRVAMDLLKHRLHELYDGTNQLANYQISISGIDSTSGLPKLVYHGLDLFGEKVFEFLRDAISVAYPESCAATEETGCGGADKSKVSLKRAQLETKQNYFSDQRLSHAFIGRDSVLTELFAYCGIETSTSLPPPPPSRGGGKGSPVTHSAPFILFTDISGTGLSTILAMASAIISDQTLPSCSSPPSPSDQTLSTTHALYHSMQAYDEAAVIPLEEEMYLSLTRLILRIILKFGRSSLIEELFVTLEQSSTPFTPFETAASFLSRLLSGTGEFRDDITPASPACVFIDSLDDKDRSLFTCLPSPLPLCLRVIISTHSSVILSSCLEHFPQSTQRTVIPLETPSIREIITTRMMVYNKRLDPTQLTLLCERSRDTNHNLHWLYMACEEVRMFGAFETVTTYISNLPTNLVDLFQVYLARIIQAGAMYQSGLVDDALRDSLLLLLCSASGLLETEFRELLPICSRSRSRSPQARKADDEGPSDQPLPLLPFSEWSSVFLFLKPLLQLTCPDESFYRDRYRPRYTFRSTQVREAVTRYFTTSTTELRAEDILLPYRRDLVSYFQYPSRDAIRQAEELPVQYMQLHDSSSLYHFLRTGNPSSVLPFNKVAQFILFLRCKQMSRSLASSFSSSSSSATPSGPPYPERMCNICAMKCTFSPKRINKMSCAICGEIIGSMYWTSQGENTVKLAPLEAYLYLCRSHGPKAYLDQKIFKPDCFVCRLPLGGGMKMSFCVVICRMCKITGGGNRCGYLDH